MELPSPNGPAKTAKKLGIFLARWPGPIKLGAFSLPDATGQTLTVQPRDQI
jgi:hypothetical protein